ncbi:hypothetical protein GQ42DRAFT_157812 [Ramicandelaber brevisporus]|nr:hypothetical protein GQ42DRAFT_157812 [Ramicandelaber brevisporus]
MERSIDLQRASQQLESLIADQKDRVSSYESLLERLDDLDNERPSSSSSSPFSIPLGPLAFVNGRIEKRDQLLVLLGANWFADMSVQRASGVAQRRLDIVKKRLGELQEDYSQLSTLVSNQQPESSRAAKATSSRSSAVTSVQDPLTQALEESGVNPNSLQDMAAARVDEHGQKIVDITEPIGDAEMKSLSTSLPSLDRSGPHGAFTSREQQQIASLFDQLELEEDSDEDENEADSDGDGNDTGSASESDDDEDDDDDGSSDGDDHNLRPTRKSAAGRRPIHQSKSTVDAGAVEAVKAQLRGTMPPKAVRMSSINLSGDGPALPSSSKPSAASTSHQARRVVDRTDAAADAAETVSKLKI